MIYFNEMSHSREFSKNGSPKVWYKPLKVGAFMSKFKVWQSIPENIENLINLMQHIQGETKELLRYF